MYLVIDSWNKQYHSHTMEDRLQGTITTLQHTQEVIVQEEGTGSDHKSEMCIGWNSIPLLSDVVTGVTIAVPITNLALLSRWYNICRNILPDVDHICIHGLYNIPMYSYVFEE